MSLYERRSAGISSRQVIFYNGRSCISSEDTAFIGSCSLQPLCPAGHLYPLEEEYFCPPSQMATIDERRVLFDIKLSSSSLLIFPVLSLLAFTA